MNLGWKYWIWWPVWKRIRPPIWFVQRGKRGWSDQDLWNFDSYLSEVLAGSLRKLAKTSHGYPAEYAEGFGPWEVPSDQVKETLTFEDWQAELRHAADLFEEIAEGDFGVHAAWTANGNAEPTKEQYQAIWDYEEAVRREALDWLSKRFGNLWD